MSANSREPREIEIRGTQIRGTPYLFPAFLVAPFLGFSPGLARAERAAEALFELGDKRVSAQRTAGFPAASDDAGNQGRRHERSEAWLHPTNVAPPAKRRK